VASGEDDNYVVSLLLTSGAAVPLPSPYFTGFTDPNEARLLGKRIAGALQIDLVERW
jgi:hypothetical protein